MTTSIPQAAEAVSSGLRAALYLRCSTRDQHLSNQRPDLVRIAKQRGLRIIRVYDEHVSAAKCRPAFAKMLADAHAGRFDCLLIWAIDRLGRSMAGNLNVILELDRLGVTVLSVREPWLDTASPVRPLLVAIFGWIAQQEQRRISARTRAGLARARAKGVRVGRPPKQLPIDEVRDLRAAGKSFREIGRLVGAGASTVHRLLAADEVLRRAVPKPGSFQIDSRTAKSLAANRCARTERFENGDGEGDDDVDL